MAEFYHAYLRRKKNTYYWLRKKEQLSEHRKTDFDEVVEIRFDILAGEMLKTGKRLRR